MARTSLMVDGHRVDCLDGILTTDGMTLLVRLLRSCDGGTPDVVHLLSAGGFDAPAATWVVPDADGDMPSGPGAKGSVGALSVRVIGGRSTSDDSHTLRTVATVGSGWSGLVIAVGQLGPVPDLAELAVQLEQGEASADRRLGRLRLPRPHPHRASQAMAVLGACTYHPTGAAVASVTTSLPEAPGADRQFDYRYCWLRDAALSVSVASLLGDKQAARAYLGFVHRIAGGRSDPPLLATITGDPPPEEREIEGVAGWAGSLPIRVGNAAASQIQDDALGIVLEAVSVHLQTGGSLDRDTWKMVERITDKAAKEALRPSNGIWELRESSWLLSADIGRWLIFDRAVWIARGWRPFARRRHWLRAREAARQRVLGALRDDGRLPQTHDGPFRADASALLVALLGMLDRRDPRAHRLVDGVLEDLGAWPFLYRYEPDATDGFHGREGAFVPVSFWAVSALANLGRVAEATERLDAMLAILPDLLPEEIDPSTNTALGNVPLLWSHAEAARALYILGAAQLRARWGSAGLWCWRIARYISLRWGMNPSRP